MNQPDKIVADTFNMYIPLAVFSTYLSRTYAKGINTNVATACL